MRKELGKIKSAYFGLGGYQEAQIGLWLDVGGEDWGVSTGKAGGWASGPSSGDKWAIEDQDRTYAKCVRDVIALLNDAKVDSVSKLVGIPVECTFDGGSLESFRVLKEVL